MATNTWCKSTPSIPYSSSSGNAARQLEGRNHLVNGGEFDPRFAPGGHAGRHAALVQASRRILDEAHPASALEQAADRRVVADVRRHAEEDDLVRVEPGEQPLGVRIREDVEALLQQQE